MKTATPENVIGVFRDQPSARGAVTVLERAGFRADEVAIVSGNVRQAREVGGSRSMRGAVAGLVAGLLLFGLFVWMGGPVMLSSGFVLFLGLVGFLGAGLVIGWLAGRARLFVEEAGAPYETAVEAGEALVSVHVDGQGRDKAVLLLREAGAVTVREERTPESA